MVYFTNIGQMDVNTKGTGKMENSTERVNSLTFHPVSGGREFGMTVSE